MRSLNQKIHSRGFSLIELMIAIVIGLILLAGLGYLFLGMKRSTETQGSISDIQENGRFALYFLTNEIQNAGWADVEDLGFGFYTSPAFQFDGTTAISDGGAANASDRITVRYEADEDCLGNAVSGIVENSFYVQDNQLMCAGSGGGTPQPLISGVEALHFIYGIDTDNNVSPNKFSRADQIAATERESIVAVKIILLLRSTDDVHPAATSQSFTIIGEPAAMTVSDRRIRKIFSTTISIPNKPTFAISS